MIFNWMVCITILPAVIVTIGQMKGQTLLPLPPQSTLPQAADPSGQPRIKDQEKIHILESAIVTWTKQIKNVLQSDPDMALKVIC
jgi:dynein heavy chain